MKEAGYMDWSTRNQLQITGQDSLLTKGLIRASLFAQYHTSILLYGFNPNFPKTVSLCLCPKSSYPAVTVSLSGLVSPWDTLMLQGLVSPLVLLYHARQPFGAILASMPVIKSMPVSLLGFLYPPGRYLIFYSQSVMNTASKSSIGRLSPIRAISRYLVTSARLRARNLEIRSPVRASRISQMPAASFFFMRTKRLRLED